MRVACCLSMLLVDMFEYSSQDVFANDIQFFTMHSHCTPNTQSLTHGWHFCITPPLFQRLSRVPFPRRSRVTSSNSPMGLHRAMGIDTSGNGIKYTCSDSVHHPSITLCLLFRQQQKPMVAVIPFSEVDFVYTRL